MTSISPEHRDILPPYLLDKDNITYVGACVSSKRLSPDSVRYYYSVQWTEPYDASNDPFNASNISSRSAKSQMISQPIPASAKEMNAKSARKKCPTDYDSDDDVALMSCLSQRSDTCTVPNACEMISCRAALIEKDTAGNDFKVKLDSEYPATARLRDVVKDLMSSAQNGGKKAKVYVIPRKKGVGLKRLEKKELEQKMVKDLERHHGNVCLVIDNTAN